MTRKFLAVVLVTFAILLLSQVEPARAVCIHNANSDLQDIDGFLICAGTGDGCDACFTPAPRGGDSWNLCYFSVASGDWSCTYYN